MKEIRRTLETCWPFFLAALFGAVFYGDILLGLRSFLFRDMELVYLPTRSEFSRRILSGELPEWYPFDGLGSGYVGNVVTAILHPSVLLHLFLPDAIALSLSALLAHAAAWAGMWLLLRQRSCCRTGSFIGATAFSFSGYLISMDGNLPYLLAASAIPWAVFFFDVSISASAGGLQTKDFSDPHHFQPSAPEDALSASQTGQSCQPVPVQKHLDEPQPYQASKEPQLRESEMVQPHLNRLFQTPKFSFLPVLGTAAAMTCLALSGDPQALYIASIFLLAFALGMPDDFRGRILAVAKLCAAGVLAISLSAPQLLPAALASSDRAQDAATLAESRNFAFHPFRLTDFISPGSAPRLPDGNIPLELMGVQKFDSYWSDDVFLGAAVLALALAAAASSRRRKREVALFSGLSLTSLCLSLGTGDNAPLYEIFQNALPAWSFLRYPEKTLIFFSFSVSVLSGFGADLLMHPIPETAPPSFQSSSLSLNFPNLAGSVWKTYQVRLALLMGISFFALLIWSMPSCRQFLLAVSGAPPEAMDELRQTSSYIQANLFLGFICTFVCFALSFPAKIMQSQKLRSCLLITVAILPLLTANYAVSARIYRADPHAVLAPSALAEDMIKAVGAIKSHPGAPRVFAQSDPQEALNILRERGIRPQGEMSALTMASRVSLLNLAAGAAGVFRVESSVGYLPLTSQNRQKTVQENLPDAAFWNGFDIGWAIVPNPSPDRLEESFIAIPNPSAAPRIRLVQGIPVQNQAEALLEAQKEGFDARYQIPVETDLDGSNLLPDRPPEGTADVVLYEPERIRVSVHSKFPATLFVADGFSDGWTASIDGVPARIYPGLIAGRAVKIPEGQHLVEMSFKTPGLRFGFALAAAAVLISMILAAADFWLWRRMKKRRVPQEHEAVC